MLAAVKRHLSITWDDADTDAKITEAINLAKTYLTEKAGGKLNFSKPTQSRLLLMDCVRYIYNNSMEYFEKNFQNELVYLQLQKAVGGNV